MNSRLILAALAVSTAVPASAATTITYTDSVPTPSPDVQIFEDFDDKADGDSIGTNAEVFSDAETGLAARPAGSTGNFGVVLGGGVANFTFARPASRFGFLLGSLDTYNGLTVNYANGTSQTFAGSGITGGAGATTGSGGGFVTIRQDAGDPRITGVSFSSSQNSFEFDTLGVGGVPEPTTWAMMILGFGVVGGAMRRRKTVSTAFKLA